MQPQQHHQHPEICADWISTYLYIKSVGAVQLSGRQFEKIMQLHAKNPQIVELLQPKEGKDKEAVEIVRRTNINWLVQSASRLLNSNDESANTKEFIQEIAKLILQSRADKELWNLVRDLFEKRFFEGKMDILKFLFFFKEWNVEKGKIQTSKELIGMIEHGLISNQVFTSVEILEITLSLEKPRFQNNEKEPRKKGNKKVVVKDQERSSTQGFCELIRLLVTDKISNIRKCSFKNLLQKSEVPLNDRAIIIAAIQTVLNSSKQAIRSDLLNYFLNEIGNSLTKTQIEQSSQSIAQLLLMAGFDKKCEVEFSGIVEKLHKEGFIKSQGQEVVFFGFPINVSAELRTKLFAPKSEPKVPSQENPQLPESPNQQNQQIALTPHNLNTIHSTLTTLITSNPTHPPLKLLLPYFLDLNSQISQLYSSPYSKPSAILTTLQHLSNLLVVASEFSISLSEIPLNQLSLKLIEQLVKLDSFEGEIIAVEQIYRAFKRETVRYQKALEQHVEMVVDEIQEHVKSAVKLLRVMGRGLKEEINHEKEQIISKLQKVSTEEFNSIGCLTDILSLLTILKPNITSTKLFKQITANPMFYSQYTNFPTLIQFCHTFQIRIHFTINAFHKIEPSLQFIRYIKEFLPDLFHQYCERNWQYYKQSIFEEFVAMVHNRKQVKVFQVKFRGPLVNGKPFIMDYVYSGGADSHVYFMNFAGYVSALYADILAEAYKSSEDQHQRLKPIQQLLKPFMQVQQACKPSNIDQLYYQRLTYWRILTILCSKLLTPSDCSTPLFQTLVQHCLSCLSSNVSPCLRQYFQLLTSLFLTLSPTTLEPTLLSFLSTPNTNLLSASVLTLGHRMLQTNSYQLFKHLIIFISCHIAYVRGLAQYYCFEFYQKNKQLVPNNEWRFLDTLVSYTVGNKDSKKLMRNIGEGVQEFGRLASAGVMRMGEVMACNYQQVEEDAIQKEVYQLLEQQGRRFISRLQVESVHPELVDAVKKMTMQAHNTVSSPLYKPLPQPSFQQYLNLNNRPSQMIVVASLLQKPPNFGHLVRTLSCYPNTTLIVPSSQIMSQPDCQQLLPQKILTSIIEIKQKDLLLYLSVQKQRGYSIVALEQATRSVPLEKFQFPKKCVLVLGNQRLGMGAELLELADHLVEIRQFGKVRSLNVHVSSVLFIWSYYATV